MTVDKKEEQKLKAMDKRHATKLEDAKKASIVTVAFTMRHSTGTLWEMVTITIQDGKVIKEEVKECFDIQHAVESFQIEFVNRFIYGQ